MHRQSKKSTVKNAALDRSFNPEYLAARKDIPPFMLQCAQGKFDKVEKFLSEEHNRYEIHTFNKDGNTMLLIAVANHHVQITKLLLDLKADIAHKNTWRMDAVDLAVMEGVRTPIAKMVLSHCDYIVPESLDGPYWHKAHLAVQELKEGGHQIASSSVIGRTPDFLANHVKDLEYTQDWLSDFHFAVGHTKKGLLLLSHEIGYLERDALLTGALEVPEELRHVYLLDHGKAIRYSSALRRPDIYAEALEKRVMEACFQGDPHAVHALLKARASPNVEDVYGQTALMRASKKGDSKIVRALLLAKAKIDSCSKDGYSALLLAAVSNHGEVTRMLVRCRADPVKKSCKGNTVMDFVKHEGHKDILRIFKEEHERHLQRQAEQKAAFAPAPRGKAQGAAAFSP